MILTNLQDGMGKLRVVINHSIDKTTKHQLMQIKLYAADIMLDVFESQYFYGCIGEATADADEFGYFPNVARPSRAEDVRLRCWQVRRPSQGQDSGVEACRI